MCVKRELPALHYFWSALSITLSQVVSSMALRPGKLQIHGASYVPTSVGKIASSAKILMTIVVLVGLGAVSYLSLGGRSAPTTHHPDETIRSYNHSTSESRLVLWSSDFHISPIADIKHLLRDQSVTIIDKSLSGHCHLTDTCERDLRVITKLNGIHLQPCARQLRQSFYDSYKSDPLMRSVDAFICTHAASMCELFMPFQKPMIIIASTRYEIGRLDTASWKRWNENLRLIAASPYNTIAANNVYDLEYIRYFTGIENIVLLPNYCGYVNVRYAPTRPEILLAPARGVNPTLQNQLLAAVAPHNNAAHTPTGGTVGTGAAAPALQIVPIRDLYSHFQYSDLAAHPAMVVLPYQVSLMSIFEFYRMQIPMFVPSARLLARWHLQYRVLNERTWMGVLGQPQEHSRLVRHPRWQNTSTSTSAISTTVTVSGRGDMGAGRSTATAPPLSDPNNEFDEAAVLEWVSLADFYQWPHIRTFDSWDELLPLLQDTALLRRMSEQMGAYNEQEEARIKREWKRILDKVRTHKENRRAVAEAAAAHSTGSDRLHPSTGSGSGGLRGSGGGSGGDNGGGSARDGSGGGWSQAGQVGQVGRWLPLSLPDKIDDSLNQGWGYTLSPSDCNAQIYSGAAKIIAQA